MKQILLLLFTALLSIGIYAQKGPAGIGNSDGSDGEPELKLWLLPDSLGLADGNDVLTWTDYSGNSNDLSAVSATSPVFKASAINSHDYLEFSKDNNRIVRNAFDMPADAVAVFMVIRTSDSGDGVLSYAVTGSDNEYLFHQSNSLTTHLSGSNDNSNVSYNDGSWKIFGHQWRSSDGRLYIHIDGTEEDNITFQSGATLTTGGNIAIGGEQDGVNSDYDIAQDFDGDIAEFIMYGSSLKQAQKTVIENYLAQKYGLDANLLQDYYVPDDASYIVALTGMGKEMDGTTELESEGLVVTQNGGFDNGEYIMAAHDGTVNSINESPGDVLHADIEARWERDWYLDKTGTVNAKIAFDFSEGINGEFPANIENYRLLYKTNLADDFDTITVAGRGIQNGDQLYFAVNDAQLLDGYYGLASVDTTNSPLDGVSNRSWYTLISGDWDNWEVWTLDPSGSLPNNPDHLTPTTSPTSNADNVVILSGKTVEVSSDTLENNIITIDGRLDFQGTSGHSFGEIKGRGRILLSGDNFPGGDATDFITAGQGEGTVEYYGTSFDLNQSLEFYDLVIDMDGTSQKLTLLADYTINGNFRIKQGEFQINDNSTTTDLNVTVTGDVNVESTGKILTGAADARHQLNLYGDLTNNGQISFTSNGAADYGTLNPAYGIVDVNFLSGTKDQTASCNGPTTFYRIEIDKGTDDTYQLVLQASNSSNFNLFGYANQTHDNVAQLDDGAGAANQRNPNALGLYRGTVRLKNNVSIPVLSTAGNYNISEAARLWVDGGTVQKNSGNSLVPYGAIQLSSGLLEAEVSSGITTRQNGLIKVEGGTLNTNVIRTSVFGPSNVGGYVQSGGTVNVVNPNSATNDYYHFSMTYPGNVFNMSGGTLHVYDASGTATGEGGIFIASDPENINVTGGTVIAEIASTTDPFKITSTAPFYNLILRNTFDAVTDHILDAGTNINGDATADLAAQPLVVLNDFTIEDDVFFDHDGNDVYIGRDFYIDRNAQTMTFDNTGMNDSYNDYNVGYLFDPAIPNNTIFNGSEDGEFYIGYNSSDGFEQYFTDFTVDKTAGSRITIVCDNQKTAQYQDDNGRNHWYARLPRIENELTVTSGILDQGQSAIRLFGPVNIGADGQCGEWIQGTTHPWAWLMIKDAELNIDTEEGAIIGNIKMNPNPTTDIITFTSDVYIKRIGYFHGRFNLQSYELKLDYLIDGLTTNNYDIDDGTASDEMFYSSGSASDGGLLLYIPAGTADGTVFPYPLGVSGKYTPAEIELSNVTDDGYIRITPVDAELQTTELTGGDLLDYYWRADYQDFTSNPTVDRLRFDYNNADIVGTEANYVAGKVLDEYPFDRIYEDETIPESEGVDAGNNRITFNGQTDAGFTLEKANYTAGEAARFVGAPQIFYTREPGDGFELKWNDGNNWTFGLNASYEPHDSRQAAAGDWPKVGDIAVIGWIPYGDTGGTDGYPHGIAVDGITVDFAEIRFSQMEDNSGNPTERKYAYNFQFRPTVVINDATGALDGSIVSGEGLFWMRWGGSKADPDFSTIDIGDFVSQDSSYFVYESKSGVYNNVPSVVPNLLIAGDGWGANDQNFELATDLRVRNNFELLGDINLILSSGATGDVIVENDLRIFRSNANGNESGGFGRIDYPNNASRSIEVYGDLRLENEQALIRVANPNTTVNESYLTVHGNIVQDNTAGGGLQLYTADNQDYVKLTLTGTGNHYYSVASGAIANFYNIEFNKGTSQLSSFTFNDSFTLNGPTSGAGVDKALTLQNGKLILNDPAINIDLTTGDDNFYIPGTAGLEVRQGQANANGGSGIILDGKLQVSGGNVDMSGGDNYIQYSASGNATLEISGGSLTVGSQIRRGLSSTEGVLNYIQSGGEVIVGNNTAPENNRGVFEILNAGSNFTHTGGNLHIVRAQSNPSFASVYLDPETSTFGAGTALRLGYTNTPANQTISIYSRVDIPNLVVDASSGTPPTAQQWTIPLTITENLEIEAGATFDANGLDLILNGDFTVNGDFTPNDNTTYFSGTGSQQIVGSPVFWNLTKDATSTLTLNNDITVNNVLRHENGTISDGGNTLSVKGDVYFDGDHTYGGGSGDGILLNGTEQQNLQGSGTYGKLSINNSEGIYVPVGNNILIDDALQLENGIFDIGRNLLELDEDAIIIEQNAFSESNMIQTNISFTDAGVKKYFPAIVPTDNFSFIYPMGSEGKYTPVEFDIDSVVAGGFIRVKAANEIHPTITNDTEPCNEIADTANVLKYHWLLEANNINGFTANASMKYYPEDYQVPEAPYDVSAYIAARLLLGSTQWNKYDQASFDETNELLLFSFTNTNDDGISGDYTAGVEDPAGICEGAIPDEVPAYITINDGDWTNAAIWESYPTPGEYPVPSGGPRGAVAIVEHDVTIPDNYILSYKTQINSAGVVMVGTTFGHRLGIVEGTGTLQLERGDMPAGIYDDFFSRSGGTIEFTGSDDYDVLSGVTNVRNLKFSGTGERRLPNLDFEVYGEFTIDGVDATLEVINEHNKNMTLDSNVVFNQGNFDAGVDPSTVTFNGAFEQVISGTGSFTGSNAFRNIELDNSAGLLLSRPIEVDGTFTMTSGLITTTAANILTMDNTSETAITGYNSTRYIDGPMRKKVNSGDDFVFPVGDGGRYGQLVITTTSSTSADYWEAEYYNENPHPTYDTSSYASPLTMVSGNEYWRVDGPEATSTSDVTIRWDDQSGLPAMSDDRANDLHIAQWVTGTPDEWQEVGDVLSNVSVNEGTLKTTSAVTLQEHYFTVASEESAPLATATFTSNDTSICAGQSVILSIDLTGDPDWIVTIEEGGDSHTFPAQSTSPLTFSVDSAGTYTITAVSDNNGAGTVFGPDVTVTVVPIPTQYNVTGGGTICSGDAGPVVDLDGSEIGVDYELFVDGSPAGSIVAGDGGSISFGNQTTDGTYTVEATDASGTCSQSMMGSVDVNVNPLPTAILTVNTALDTICNGDNTEIEINFTAGTAPFDFTVRRTDESSNTDDEALSGISANPYTYIPASAPTWIDDGTPEKEYNYTITTITDNTGCSNTNQGNADVVVFKIPETGPQYHIPNVWSN